MSVGVFWDITSCSMIEICGQRVYQSVRRHAPGQQQ